MNRNILNNTSFIKTILMLLVMLDHACAFWTGNWFTGEPVIPSATLNIVCNLLGSFHVFSFALISGYLFAFKTRKGDYASYIPFLKNKAKRLLVPYLFSMLVWVAPVSQHFFHWDNVYLFRKYILCIDPSQLWFLWMLFDVFALIWPLRRIFMDKPATAWIIAIGCFCAGVAGKKILPNIFCIWTAFQYIPFFYLGMRIRCKEENSKNSIDIFIYKNWYLWTILDVLLFLAVRYLDTKAGMLWGITSVGMTFLLHGVGAVMALTVLHAVAERVPWQKSNVFGMLSSYSMPMYLFHQQIIYFMLSFMNGKLHPWFHAAVNYFVAIFGSFLISALLMRWKVTRTLVGE